MDRRQLKTRKAIFDAFMRLTERQPYSSITVQEIIDEANVGRSTFYSHFETKDDLLRSLCAEIFAHVFSHELIKEKTHDFSTGADDMREKVTHILYHLQDSRANLRGILSGESGELYMEYFKSSLAQVFDSALIKIPPDIPRDYILHHVVCDFAETVRWWLKSGRYTPEEIGRFYMSTTPYFGERKNDRREPACGSLRSF